MPDVSSWSHMQLLVSVKAIGNVTQTTHLCLYLLCNPTHKVLIRYLQSRSLSHCPFSTMTTSKGKAGSLGSDG